MNGHLPRKLSIAVYDLGKNSDATLSAHKAAMQSMLCEPPPLLVVTTSSYASEYFEASSIYMHPVLFENSHNLGASAHLHIALSKVRRIVQGKTWHAMPG